MAFNAMSAAIKKMRAKKNDYMSQDEIESGTEYLDPKLREQTDLAPSIKKPEQAMMNDMDEIEEEENEEQMMGQAMQDMGGDQGDAMDKDAILKGMYQEGDENKKGF